MKLKLTVIIILACSGIAVYSQTPQEIYHIPLRDVLTDIGNKYNVRLQYSESLVKGVDVSFPTWRYRSDIEATLTNILMPLDMIFEKTGNDSYSISRYSYYQRPVEEGKKHLDRLLAIYPVLSAWEARKKELKACFLRQLNLDPMPRKTPLNPIYTPRRKMNGYTVENVAIETLPGVYLCGSLYRHAKGKGPFPAVLSPHGHFALICFL